MAVSPTERQQILSQVNTLAVQDLVALWRQATGLATGQFAPFMVDAFPGVVDPYAAMAGDLAADWYDESAPDLDYQATPSGMPNVQALQESTQWALGASGDAALARLAGTLQRAVFNGARDTIVENTDRERGSRWARHASANACEFCSVMATRGAVFRYRSTAAKGHDFCKCTVIEQRPGTDYEPAPYVERFESEYNAARKLAGSGDLSQILSAMRQIRAS